MLYAFVKKQDSFYGIKSRQYLKTLGKSYIVYIILRNYLLVYDVAISKLDNVVASL
jgi:hypothetical protein